jgi:hypothetical protein
MLGQPESGAVRPSDGPSSQGDALTPARPALTCRIPVPNYGLPYLDVFSWEEPCGFTAKSYAEMKAHLGTHKKVRA